MDHDTIPSSMRTQMVGTVTAEKRSEMDSILSKATNVFYKTVLED
jgi:hypothetical protein